MISKKVRFIIYGILLLILGANWGGKLYNNHQIEQLPYGIKANPLRQQLHIPIIESEMEAKHRYDEFKGNQWLVSQEFPEKNEVLHIFKTVSTKPDQVLHEETDAYRRYIDDSTHQHLTINSLITNDSIVLQTGISFYIRNRSFEWVDRDKVTYTDSELAKTLKEWKLNF